jgi:hypothetical protein
MAKYDERRIDVTKFVGIFAIATLIFVIGILIGTAIVSMKESNIKESEDKLRLELIDLEVQQELAQTNPCNNYFLYSLGERLADLGNRLTLLENQLGKTNKDIIELKKPYTLLEVRHYLLIKERVEQCNENYTTILFFYSNKKEQVSESERQGYVLGFLSKKYGSERLKVYSIDGDLDLGIVSALKSNYNISYMPSTVIDDKVFIGFHEKEDLEQYIN